MKIKRKKSLIILIFLFSFCLCKNIFALEDVIYIYHYYYYIFQGDYTNVWVCAEPNDPTFENLPDGINPILVNEYEPGYDDYVDRFYYQGRATKETAENGHDEVAHMHKDWSTTIKCTPPPGGGCPSYMSYRDKYHRFRIDDFSNIPADKKHIGKITADDNDYVKGYLNNEEKWEVTDYEGTDDDDDARERTFYLSADTDVFEVVTLNMTELDEGVYCLETKIDGKAPPNPLDITIYEANGNNYGDEIGNANSFNCYNSNGEIDKLHQRLYFELDSDQKLFIKINSTDTSFKGKYGIRVLKVRPVILVHGIECFPKEEKHIAEGKNSMGHWDDYLQWDKNIIQLEIRKLKK